MPFNLRIILPLRNIFSRFLSRFKSQNSKLEFNSSTRQHLISGFTRYVCMGRAHYVLNPPILVSNPSQTSPSSLSTSPPHRSPPPCSVVEAYAASAISAIVVIPRFPLPQLILRATLLLRLLCIPPRIIPQTTKCPPLSFGLTQTIPTQTSWLSVPLMAIFITKCAPSRLTHAPFN